MKLVRDEFEIDKVLLELAAVGLKRQCLKVQR